MTPKLNRELLDLGKDTERMPPADARRQADTVDRILQAFFTEEDERRELQVLADEVGLGKTFVALATAYVTLDELRTRGESPTEDLRRAYRAVVVVSPGSNHTLADKWSREVTALTTRCSPNPAETAWFTSKKCSTPDQLFEAILQADDRRRNAPVVLVVEANVFTKRLSDVALRFFTSCLFRWWGSALPVTERARVIRGLAETANSEHWAEAITRTQGDVEVLLWDHARHVSFLRCPESERPERFPLEYRDFSRTSLTWEQVSPALSRLDATEDGKKRVEDLRRLCRDAPQRRPGDRRTLEYREWQGYFRTLKDRLRDVYEALWPFLLDRPLPLVIADEAHHWRNPYRRDARAFRDNLAPYARRLLLLTATPFQLHRDELGTVLSVSDHLALPKERREALSERRQRILQAMSVAEERGMKFSRAWGQLSAELDAESVGRSDGDTSVVERSMAELESSWAVAQERDSGALLRIPERYRAICRAAIEAREANLALESCMRPLVIRHRRETKHRRYWIGREYPRTDGLRPDQHLLHPAIGHAIEPGAELAQYLLMKVVAVATRGRHRTALGTQLTGCYSSLWHSKEGQRAVNVALEGGASKTMDVLKRLTGHGRDPNPRDRDHPKMRVVVDEVVRRWKDGEKSLIFCFRTKTAETLHRLIRERISAELSAARRKLLETRHLRSEKGDEADAMHRFRASLTARNQSGVRLFVDRVLAGFCRVTGLPLPSLDAVDLEQLAALCARARFGDDWLFADPKRIDRVFLSRALEHLLVQRHLSPLLPKLGSELRRQGELLVDAMSSERWVTFRYGLDGAYEDVDTDDGSADRVARSSLSARFSLDDVYDPALFKQMTELLRGATREGSILETLLSGPNLFAPSGPVWKDLREDARAEASLLATDLLSVGWTGHEWNWADRRQVVDAVVRAFLRDDLLLRLPSRTFSEGDETWADALFRGFHAQPGGGQREPLSARIREFVSELAEMSDKERSDHVAYAMRATAESVTLVTGGAKEDQRNAIFTGFNTPLLPDVLVCTSVGQEGIDLHRHCRHVVHYDLAFNPAAIEQRTGRVDRLGSKAARERRLAGAATNEAALPGLDIGIPYLAGTYDDRIFDTLRVRAQSFDILTGGTPVADRGADDVEDADIEGTAGAELFVPLPQVLLDDLRVDLSVEGRSRSGP